MDLAGRPVAGRVLVDVVDRASSRSTSTVGTLTETGRARDNNRDHSPLDVAFSHQTPFTIPDDSSSEMLPAAQQTDGREPEHRDGQKMLGVGETRRLELRLPIAE